MGKIFAMPTDSTTMKQQLVGWIFSTLCESAWAPLSVFSFYLLGLALHLYQIYPPLDIPTHFMGGVAITYFYRSAIRQSQKYIGDIPLSVQVILALTATGTTTVLWEFAENFIDHFFGTQMVRGLEDSLLDMFLGLFGALILSMMYRRR